MLLPTASSALYVKFDECNECTIYFSAREYLYGSSSEASNGPRLFDRLPISIAPRALTQNLPRIPAETFGQKRSDVLQ
jgi:hypothetical protein